MAGVLAVQLIGAKEVGDLQEFLVVLSALSFDYPGHPLKVTTSGTIEVSAPIDQVSLVPTVGGE